VTSGTPRPGRREAGFGEFHEGPEARGFGFEDGAAVRGEAVIAAALIVEMRFGTLVGFLDQTALGEFADCAVEAAWTEFDAAAGPDGYFALDGVAVLFMLREADEDFEVDVWEGEKRRGVEALLHSWYEYITKCSRERREGA